MADLSKIKGTGGKNRFGNPPTPEVKSDTLKAPEAAPASPEPLKRKARAKTGRTVSWGTKVGVDFPKRIKRVAFERDLKVAELLEVWLEKEEKKLNS